MRTFLPIVLLLLASLAGCAGSPSQGEESLAPVGDLADFRVPGIRVGDTFLYSFGFKNAAFTAGGQTKVEVLENTRVQDGTGHSRDALHIRQASPQGGFAEDYWVDATNLQQFELGSGVGYNQSSKFPASQASAVPVRHAIYANATGARQRFLDDPILEDFNFFGAFATGRDFPAEGTLNVTGILYARNTTDSLGWGSWPAQVSDAGRDDTWGPLRGLDVAVTYAQGSDSEQIHWKGTFSVSVPLATEMVRTIKAQFGKSSLDVTFNATLQGYTPGAGDAYVRVEGQVPRTPRNAERAAWTTTPPEGTGSKLPFPLAEAITALQQDQTASGYLSAHKDTYLRYAHMYEIDTCGFYPTPPPGCHWYTWYGIFGAGDDQELTWQAEKYADGTGGGVSLVPPVSREYPFDTAFGAPGGQTPQVPPPSTVVVRKATNDLPPRATFAADAYTMSAAIDTWKALGAPNNGNLVPNLFALYLYNNSYAYYVSRSDWVWAQNAQLTPAYDHMWLEAERHTTDFYPDGWVPENVNYDVKVAQN